MAGGDRTNLKIACPKCSQKGILRIIEHGHGYSRIKYKEIGDIIEGDFRDALQGRGEINDVVCNLCETRFSPSNL